MAIIGVASVRVRPDLSGFRGELNRDLEKIKVELKIPVAADTDRAERDVREFIARMSGKDIDLNVDIDTRTFQNADRDTNKLRNTFLGIGKASLWLGKEIASNTVKLAGFAVAAGAVASSIAGTASVIGGLGQAIAAIGVAGVGIGAAGLTAFAAATATVKIGLIGVGDAMKAVAEGDSKKLAEALKGLSPNARSFVQEMQKLKPLFDDLKLDIQEKLFKDLGSEVSLTAKALQGPISSALGGIAVQLNNTAKSVLGFLREAETVKTLKGIGDNIVGGMREAQGAAKSFTSALLDIVHAGSALLPELGAGLEGVAAKFAAFIRAQKDSGHLTQIFRDAIDDVKRFGRTIRDVGVGISNIFHISSSGTGGFLQLLESAAKKFREFTESIGGQLIISEVVQIIKDLSGSFGIFLKAISPILPVVAKFAALLADSLGQILEALGPIIAELATTLLNTLGEVLPDLIPFIIDVAEAIGKILVAITPLLKPLGKLLEALTPLLDPLVRLAQRVVPPLVDILEKLTPLIALMAEGLGLIVDVISGAIDGIANLGHALELALNPLQTFQDLLLGVLGIGTGETEKVKKGFRQVGHDAMTAIEEGLDGKKASLFGTIRSTIDQMIDLWAFSSKGAEDSGETFMAAVNRGMTSQEAALSATINKITNTVLGLLTGRQGDFNTSGISLGHALSNGLTVAQQEAVDAVRNTLQKMLDAMSGKRSSFDAEGRAISDRLGGGIRSNQAAAVDAARSASFAIAGAFGGISLFGEGAAIMASLKNGIISGIQAVKNVLTSMTSLIPTWKGPESTDKKLLTPSGQWIMRGLVDGIESEIPMLESSLRSVTDRVESSFGAGSGLSMTGSSTLSISGGLEPTPVLVDVTLNEGELKNVIDVRINEDNRGVRRRVLSGVNS